MRGDIKKEHLLKKKKNSKSVEQGMKILAELSENGKIQYTLRSITQSSPQSLQAQREIGATGLHGELTPKSPLSCPSYSTGVGRPQLPGRVRGGTHVRIGRLSEMQV